MRHWLSLTVARRTGAAGVAPGGAKCPAARCDFTGKNAAADWGRLRAMKHPLSIATSLVLGCALTLTACGKDKKPTPEPAKATEPAAAAPAKTDPAAPAAPAAAAKPEDKKDDKGGW